DQSEIARRSTREHLLHAIARQPKHPGEQSAEHGAIVVQHREIAVLEQRRLLDLLLLARDAPALHGAAEHPIGRTMAVIGAAIAVLAEGAAKLADHDHDGVMPGRTHALGKARKPAAELAEPAGEIAVGAALVDVRVPPADVDEAEIESLLHQGADAPRRE